jgi:hypothetical protein
MYHAEAADPERLADPQIVAFQDTYLNRSPGL